MAQFLHLMKHVLQIFWRTSKTFLIKRVPTKIKKTAPLYKEKISIVQEKTSKLISIQQMCQYSEKRRIDLGVPSHVESIGILKKFWGINLLKP